jgi:hypothetical protein
MQRFAGHEHSSLEEAKMYFNNYSSSEEYIENLFNGGTLRQQFDFSKP